MAATMLHHGLLYSESDGTGTVDIIYFFQGFA